MIAAHASSGKLPELGQGETRDAVGIGRAIEERERPAAEKRQRATRFGAGKFPAPGRPANTGANLAQVSGKTRDHVGQAVGIGRAIEERERPAAKDAQRAGLKQYADRGANLAPRDQGKTRDAAAKAVGMKHATYEKAKAVGR